MGQTLGIVIPLAAGAAVSPAVLTLQLVTLSGRISPLARSWAIAGSYALVLAGLVVVGLLLAASTGGSGTASETEAAVKLAAAVLLAVLGVRMLTRQPKPPKDHGDASASALGRYAAIGGVLMITNVTTAVLFIPAVHDVGVADISVEEKAGALALVFLITLLPAAGPPLGATLLGDRAQGALTKLNGFTTRHKRAINAGICFAFSAFLAAVSLPDLL